eukprot:scpid21981/ scgid27204/ 
MAQEKKSRKSVVTGLVSSDSRRRNFLSKRKNGLLKKAAELHVGSGAKVLVVVVAPSGVRHTYSSHPVDEILPSTSSSVTTARADPVACSARSSSYPTAMNTPDSTTSPTEE